METTLDTLLESPDEITFESIVAEERAWKRRDPAGYARHKAEQAAYSTVAKGSTAKGYAEAAALIAKKDADDVAWDIDCALHNWRLAAKAGKRDSVVWTSREKILARASWPGVEPADWDRFQEAARTWLQPWATPEALAYGEQRDYERAVESLEDPRTIDAHLLQRVHDPANIAKIVEKLSEPKVRWLIRNRLHHRKPDLWNLWFPLLHARLFGPPPTKATKAMPPSAQPAIGLVTTRAADVKPRNPVWLWGERIALGKLSLLAGDQGLGKTTILLDIIARITRGAEWPCGEGRAPNGSVIYMGTEDDEADTLVPRLLACGADLSKVHFVRAAKTQDGKGQRSFSLATDLTELGKLIAQIGDVVAVIIDPINSYFGRGADTYKTADVRTVLEPLAEMASRLEVSFIGNSHLGKDAKARNANMRILDSQAITAVSRGINLVVPDPDNKDRQLFIRSKASNAKAGLPALAYTIRSKGVAITDAGDLIYGTCPEWAATRVEITADEAFGRLEKKGRAKPAQDEAEAFIYDILAKGQVDANEVLDAARARCISSATLRLAAQQVGVEHVKLEMKAGWAWKLPAARTPTSF